MSHYKTPDNLRSSGSEIVVNELVVCHHARETKGRGMHGNNEDPCGRISRVFTVFWFAIYYPSEGFTPYCPEVFSELVGADNTTSGIKKLPT